MSGFHVFPGTSSSTSDYTILPPLSDGTRAVPLLSKLSSRLDASWRKFIRSTPRLAFVTDVTIIPAVSTTVVVSTVLMNERLSSEDREAHEKGLQLVARIEHLYQTDEEFRRWYQEGIDEIEAGQFVTFSEDGWQEE